MRRFAWTHPRQREMVSSYAESIGRAAASLMGEINKDHPDVDVLERLSTIILQDLQVMRKSYIDQRAAKPVKEGA